MELKPYGRWDGDRRDDQNGSERKADQRNPRARKNRETAAEFDDVVAHPITCGAGTPSA